MNQMTTHYHARDARPAVNRCRAQKDVLGTHMRLERILEENLWVNFQMRADGTPKF